MGSANLAGKEGGREGGGAVSGSEGRLRASKGDNEEGVACEDCRATISRGQVVVELAYGRTGMFCTAVRGKLQSDEGVRRHRFSSVLEVAQSAMEEGMHWWRQFRPTLGYALQQ